MPKIYIVAGNYREARMYANFRELPPQDYAYVRDEFSLYGLKDILIVFAGSWYERRDAQALRDAAGTRTSNIKYDTLYPR